ncbi:hypothetical protein SAMN05661080_04188 [Modestobacter sp. DSM 44400]|uniref:DUF2933 domain-containing protein n=1 Tax=Modestobacter sp. DSM 44400 TaxID=1550230 RepID=UPI000898913C|nr:DUF2933 domain-containing protein [Modestobacter sp. DSM 44400]SDY65843.1 hypothetical protein SAMN05661080_04188 [Modestobacter sp. DSM 44400]
MLRSLRCCLNPKVIAGLAAVGVVIWLVAPAGGAAALPLLIALVCPLSMGAMAWRMRRGQACASTNAAAARSGSEFDTDAELRALREEVAMARARLELAEREDRPRS